MWTWLTWAARVEFLESILAGIGWASGGDGGRTSSARVVEEQTVEERWLVTSSSAVQHEGHTHTGTHTKETGGGEESEEAPSGVKVERTECSSR